MVTGSLDGVLLIIVHVWVVAWWIGGRCWWSLGGLGAEIQALVGGSMQRIKVKGLGH